MVKPKPAMMSLAEMAGKPLPTLPEPTKNESTFLRQLRRVAGSLASTKRPRVRDEFVAIHKHLCSSKDLVGGLLTRERLAFAKDLNNDMQLQSLKALRLQFDIMTVSLREISRLLDE